MFSWSLLVLFASGLFVSLARILFQRFYRGPSLSSASAYYQRARSFADVGNYRLALADLGKAIELDPQHAQAYWIRGAIYRQQHRYTWALADFTQAIDLKPDLAPAYYGRGKTYEATGNQERARADFAQAHALDPRSYPRT